MCVMYVMYLMYVIYVMHVMYDMYDMYEMYVWMDGCMHACKHVCMYVILSFIYTPILQCIWCQLNYQVTPSQSWSLWHRCSSQRWRCRRRLGCGGLSIKTRRSNAWAIFCWIWSGFKSMGLYSSKPLHSVPSYWGLKVCGRCHHPDTLRITVDSHCYPLVGSPMQNPPAFFEP